MVPEVKYPLLETTDRDKSREADIQVVTAAYFLRQRFINLKFSFPDQILEKVPDPSQ